MTIAPLQEGELTEAVQALTKVIYDKLDECTNEALGLPSMRITLSARLTPPLTMQALIELRKQLPPQVRGLDILDDHEMYYDEAEHVVYCSVAKAEELNTPSPLCQGPLRLLDQNEENEEQDDESSQSPD